MTTIGDLKHGDTFRDFIKDEKKSTTIFQIGPCNSSKRHTHINKGQCWETAYPVERR